jgi:outer membrane protein assembly factor BamA
MALFRPTHPRLRVAKPAWRALLCLLLLVLRPVWSPAETNSVELVAPAALRVSGYGLLENRALRRSLRELQADRQAPVLDANFIEDAFLVLLNRLQDDGYLKPLIVGHLTLTNGEVLVIGWNGREELEVPRGVQVGEAHFEAFRGVLFYYDELEIKGLTAIPESRAKGFFLIRDSLLNLKSSRRFSPDSLQTSMRGLRRELVNLGYRDAVVEVEEQWSDPVTGQTHITLRVREGRKYVVRSWRLASPDPGAAGVELPALPEAQPYSLTWEQDAAQAVEVELYRKGYPDAQARLVEVGRSEAEEVVWMDLEVEVERGEQVELGQVRFEGAGHSRESFLLRRARVEGPLLDRVEADQGRERLARLGSFRFVDLRLEPDTGSPRDVVYELTEGRRYELSLIGGYGSYDQFFGAFEFQHYNLWGIGHNTRLKVVQSLKSTLGAYTYTVPEFLRPNLDLYASANGYQGQELTYDQQELKLSLGLRQQLPRSGQQVGLRYSYEFLAAQTDAIGDEDTRAAAIIADWQIDRRDNPLLPRDGYRLYANIEYSDPVLGGQSDYTRVELGAAYHHPFSRGLIGHVGLLHDIAYSPDPDTSLPFNKRFFPGGANSVRGYQRGGASPLDANGEQLGAVSVLQWNLELEQYLTRTISIVGFLDGAGITPDLDTYPFDQVLWSVGGGVRWNTVIGPVRLEYGYNLDPRPADPTGTLHFSIGYPF